MKYSLGNLPKVAEQTKIQFAEEACRLFRDGCVVDANKCHWLSLSFWRFFASCFRKIPYERTTEPFLRLLRETGHPPIDLITTEELLWLNMEIIHHRLNLETNSVVAAGEVDVKDYFNSIFGNGNRAECAAVLHRSVEDALSAIPSLPSRENGF